MKSPIATLGSMAGGLLGPLVGAGATSSGARLFHPEGLVFRATVTSVATEPGPSLVAARLAGPALVRCSAAWWREREWPDVLGLAIRFRTGPRICASAAPGDQDLLLTTMRRPWSLPLAPLTTRQHDFLANDYHGLSRFNVDGIGHVYLRLVPARLAPGHDDGDLDRTARLLAEVGASRAKFFLAARPVRGDHWWPLVELWLREPLAIDQAALHFSPFRDARGLHPGGLIHALRHRSYRLARKARRWRARHAGAPAGS